MRYKCTKCGKTVYMRGDAIVVGPNDDVICDGCSGVQRDSQGRLVEVMAEYRRGWAMELILYGVVGVIFGALLWAVIVDVGLAPFFWGLIPW